MPSTQPHGETAIGASTGCMVDMTLEVVVIPVSGVDRAKRFYDALGWRLTPTSAWEEPLLFAAELRAGFRPLRKSSQFRFST